jgi:hypothetical protein
MRSILSGAQLHKINNTLNAHDIQGGRRACCMRGGALCARKAARHGHLGRGPRRPIAASRAVLGE